MHPTLSARKLSNVTGVSRATVQIIPNHDKWHSYQIYLLQELNEDDRRFQYCGITSEICNYKYYTYHPCNVCFSEKDSQWHCQSTNVCIQENRYLINGVYFEKTQIKISMMKTCTQHLVAMETCKLSNGKHKEMLKINQLSCRFTCF